MNPLDPSDIEDAQTRKSRPERDWSDSMSDALALVILLALFTIACCCGAGVVGALWAVTG
jgi:hypothetical protein